MVGEGVPFRLALGVLFSAAIGIVAYRRRSLSRSGVVGAVATGTAIFGFGGWVRGLLLIAFFASSSALSHYKDGQKATVAEKFAKGNRRDLAQTLANGGMAALIAVFIGLLGRDAALYPVLALAFYGALATVTADTWATELGVLAAAQPRLITNRQRVPAGTSGGITPQGTLASLAGAAFIGVTGFVVTQGASIATGGGLLLQEWILLPVAAVSGLGGAAFDSVLGATVQAMYRCDACGVDTERTVHQCGQTTRPVRGWRWLNNDWVNFIASIAGAALAALLAILIF